ncbi:MAG: hypothetical protein K0R57_5000 [Paenibacillaceae bacterium]|jgi:hypothetical protein|nr:hypothetical protein [Paenibacillaceae bacterium]
MIKSFQRSRTGLSPVLDRFFVQQNEEISLRRQAGLFPRVKMKKLLTEKMIMNIIIIVWV